MFETFLHNNVEPAQRVDEHILSRFENTEDGFDLWFAEERLWPLQQMDFEGVVATPKELCCLEKILLYIYQLIPNGPPDSKTITERLFLGDTSFVDKIISELVDLGALQIDSAGRLVVTDLGRQCCSRGQLPGKGRKQKLSLCFDPLAHEFPKSLLFPDTEQDHNGDSDLQPIAAAIHQACANRIDLDTVQRVAASQNLLSGGDAVVFSAEPASGEQEPVIIWRHVYVLVFLNEQGKILLRIHDPKSTIDARWFQGVLDRHLKAGYITLADLLGSLAVPAETITNRNGNLSGLSTIAVHKVQDKILSAINNADKSLLIQAQGFGNNGNEHTESLLEAIINAADRGVRCRLLWGGTEINDNIPEHKNIDHRLVSTIERESLIADDIVLAASISKVIFTDDKPAGGILTVGESKRPLVCRKWKEKSIEAWQSGDLAVSTEAAGLQKNNNRITTVVTADAVQQESEVQE